MCIQQGKMLSTLDAITTRHLKTLKLRGDRIQLNFLGQTAASRCEGFPTFRVTTPFPSSGYASGLVAPKTDD